MQINEFKNFEKKELGEVMRLIDIYAHLDGASWRHDGESSFQEQFYDDMTELAKLCIKALLSQNMEDGFHYMWKERQVAKYSWNENPTAYQEETHFLTIQWLFSRHFIPN